MGLKDWLYQVMRLLWNIYYFCKKNHNYWNDREVRCVRPRFGYGNLKPFWQHTHPYTTVIQDIYNQCKNCRYYGFYQVNLPVLTIRDPSLIKEIISLECFQPYKSFASPSADAPFTNVPYQIEETDGYRQLKDAILRFLDSRIHSTTEVMKKRPKSLVTSFKGFVAERDYQGALSVHVPFRGISCDIPAEVVFGLIFKYNAMRNDTTGLFYPVDLVANFWKKREDFLRASSYPASSKLYDLNHYGEMMKEFFQYIEYKALEKWRSNELQNETSVLKDITGFRGTNVSLTIGNKLNLMGELIMAGFGSTARIMTYMIYELALSEDVQNRLQREVDEIFQNKNVTPMSCDVIEKMQYMNMVNTEVLRKWPPYSVTDLQVIKPSTIQPQCEEEQPLVLEKGHICAILVFPIHRDPINFVNPEVFNPERFSNGIENMRMYLPFGAGPKRYLNQRYSLLEIKILMSYLLRNFKLRPKPSVTDDLEALTKESFHPEPDPLLLVVLEPRQQSV